MIRIFRLSGILVCLSLRAQTAGNSIIQVTNLPDGWASLIQGSDGNFYGVTQFNGGTGVCSEGPCGAVEKATPSGAVSVIYSFQPGPNSSNTNPFPSSLIQGTDGNFYGTTSRGGSPACDFGCGIVFKLTPSGTFTTLHTFDSTDGNSPQGLVEGNDGNFYGFANSGGSTCQFGIQCGTIFQVTPQGAFTLLYSFDSKHGASPASLIKGADGNFYGTAEFGGTSTNCPSSNPGLFPNGCGTVFEITPSGTVTTLYTFQAGSDGAGPTFLRDCILDTGFVFR